MWLIMYKLKDKKCNQKIEQIIYNKSKLDWMKQKVEERKDK